MLGNESSKAMRDRITTTSEQRSRSRSSAKENLEARPRCSKRRRFVTDTNVVVSKRTVQRFRIA